MIVTLFLVLEYKCCSSRRRPVRDASWDFGTGTIQTTGTVRSSMKALYGGTDQDGRLGANENSRPASSEPLPSLLSKADLDYQIDAGLRDAMDMNGSRQESFPGMQKGQDTESFSPRDIVSESLVPWTLF
jgi:hypothetical protein